MSDLTGKFTGFEGQIAANHIEIMAALNSLIEGIGGVPTTPSATLTDVITALTTINSNIVGMRSANALYYSQALGLLEAINTNTDTLINNNSLNAQRLLAAIYATFCECDTTNPILAPPLDVTPTELTDDPKCRRIQFYLAVFSTWLTSIANYGSTGASITGGVLESLLVAAGAAFGMTATGAEIGAAGGLPGVVVGAVIGAIVAAIYAFGGAALVDYAGQFASPVVQADLLAALYDADNAEEGQAAFQSVVSDAFPYLISSIIIFLWYAAWSNDLYSGTPAVDDSMFDGTICAPPAGEVVLTESCGDLINQVWPGTWDSGDRNGATYTHFILGAASAGSGTVKLFADTIEVLNLDVANNGQDKTWIGVAANVRVIVSVSADTYIHLQACTGTYGPG